MISYSMTNQMRQLILFFLKNAYCLLDFVLGCATFTSIMILILKLALLNPMQKFKQQEIFQLQIFI